MKNRYIGKPWFFSTYSAEVVLLLVLGRGSFFVIQSGVGELLHLVLSQSFLGLRLHLLVIARGIALLFSLGVVSGGLLVAGSFDIAGVELVAPSIIIRE